MTLMRIAARRIAARRIAARRMAVPSFATRVAHRDAGGWYALKRPAAVTAAVSFAGNSGCLRLFGTRFANLTAGTQPRSCENSRTEVIEER